MYSGQKFDRDRYIVMQLTRLISTFAVNVFLLISGYMMYSNDKIITGPVWASIFTIATVMTLVVALIWNLDDLMLMYRQSRQQASQKLKKYNETETVSLEDELGNIRKRLQGLENKISLNNARQNLSTTDEQWQIIDDQQIIKRSKNNHHSR